MAQPKPIIWLTGQKRSGKTTLAYGIKTALPGSVVIDEQDVKKLFTDAGSEEVLLTVQKFAELLQAEGYIPVVSFISPSREVREALKGRTKVFEVYCHSDQITEVEGYEPPLAEFFDMDTGSRSFDACVAELLIHYKKSCN